MSVWYANRAVCNTQQSYSPPGEGESSSRPRPPAFKGLSKVLILHGDQDNVFPLADAERTAAVFRTNGIRVDLNLLTGHGHNPGPNRELVFRAIGEYCLTHLNGPGALARYRSIAAWRDDVKPLWAYSVPAMLWIAACLLSNQWRQLRAQSGSKLTRWEIVLRGFATILATLALGLTAFHLITPQLGVSNKTLAAARGYLIQPNQRHDFDFLVAESVWAGQRLKTLLAHVELANYNRELVNWKLDDQIYRAFVLSPQIGAAFEEELNWRRPLWESCYPRVRRAQSLEAAAEIVVRHLRERVTIAKGENLPPGVESIWRRQLTDARGFELLYVAALRSTGIPARLDSQARVEFWAETGWKPAPRPLIESLQPS